MVDENLINLCYRSLDRVVCLCQQPQLNLKNSPPYILDTIPDLYEKLQSILTYYQPDNLDTLGQIDYFQIFVKSLIDRCRITIRLFKDAKDKIFEPSSTARSRLIKLSLIFSHLLKDLNTLFPENGFDLNNYRITKYDAAKWWSSNFPGQSIVPWTLFFQTLSQTFPELSNRHALRLKQTIDLTCNDYVSIFEFDVFTRLFQPWANIIETWEALTIRHPGYMSFMTYDEFKAVLNKFQTVPGPGTYVFRISCTKPGQWVIGYITKDLRILQTIIQNKSLAQALLDGEREGFYLFPNGEPSPRRLLYQLVHNQTLVHLQVSQEQYQAYCEVGSTFELCKICDENNKDIQLEPCRHLICRNCLLNCQLTGNGQTCPFCRLEIKGIEEVVVDPYKPQSRSSSPPPHDVLMMSSSSSSASLCRQLSLDKPPAAATCLSKNLIDLSDCPSKKPPPIPPRHSSRSPPILISGTPLTTTAITNCVRLVSQPMEGKDLTLPSNLPSCSTRGSSDHLVPADSDRCRCTSHTTTTSSSTSSVTSHPGSNKPDLHYAQLDLIDSDSEMEPEPDLTTSSDQQSDHRHRQSSTPVPTHSQTLLINHSTQTPPISLDCLIPIQDHYDQLNDRPCGPHLCDICRMATSRMTSTAASAANLDSSSSSSSSFPNLEHNINHLVDIHPDMTRQQALFLLTLTENRLDMSHRIWEHFQPRTD